MTCGRCGAEFEALVDGGCPDCGRKVVAGKAPPRRPARVRVAEGGSKGWPLIGAVALAVAGGAGWFVYQKVTHKPPPAAVAPAKTLATLKDWRDTIAPAQLVPGMEALKALLDKADEKKPEELASALNRIVEAVNQTDARVMLLSALEGRKGRAAGGILTVLSARMIAYAHYGDEKDYALLQKLTIAGVLDHVGSADADARQGVAFCLRQLSDAWVMADGRRVWAPEPGQKVAMSDAARRLLKDERPETRECAEKVLEKLR